MIGIRQTAIYLRRYLRGMGVRLAVCLLFGLLQSVSVLPVAWLIRRVFDQVIPAHNVRLLLLNAGGILISGLAAGAFGLLTRTISLRVTKRVIAEIRQDLIRQYYDLPRSFHDTTDRGALHNLVVQDTQQLDSMINTLIPAVTGGLQGLALLLILAVLDAKLLFIVMLAVPAMRLVSRRISAKLRVSALEQRKAFAQFSSAVQLALQNLDLTRYQSAERLETNRHYVRIQELRTLQERLAWLQTAYATAQSTLISVAGLVVLVAGGIEVAAGSITVGALLCFYVAMALLSSSASQVLGSVPIVMSGFESLRALAAFTEVQAAPPYRGTKRVELQRELSVHDISFSYGSKQILERLSLTLRRGTISVLIGTNGGGKTSLARLILGLYRPTKGYLAVDGIPFDEIDLEHFRRGLSFTAQDPELFTGTIRQNICYGLAANDEETFERACALALVDEFVQRLPNGYETRVGEEGAALSGGQRQKIAIARALARQPKLLILDEPTNHLDPDSVEKLMRNLQNLPGNPAVLIITQNQAISRNRAICYRLSECRLVRELGGAVKPIADLEEMSI